MTGTMNRNEFLKKVLLGGSMLIGTGSLFSMLTHYVRKPKNYPVFDHFPPDFHNMNPSDHCYIIVHPGYSNYRGMDEHNKIDKYGQYQEYLENIKQLIKYLETKEELTIFALEDGIFQNKIQNEEVLSSLESSIVIITKSPFLNLDIQNWGPSFYKRAVKVKNRKMRQRPDIIYSLLKDKGVREARFAGEWGWVDEGIDGFFSIQDVACVGQVAEDFYSNGFEIKGIEGCVYPTIKPKSNNKILRILYDDMISVSSVRLRRATE